MSTASNMSSTNRTVTLAAHRNFISSATPIDRTIDLDTTINKHLKIDPSKDLLPGEVQHIKYLGVGINGFRSVNDGSTLEPHRPLATNMNLYHPIPIRIVPEEEDLGETERLKYRLRRRENHGGDNYIAYYLKVMEYPENKIIMTKNNGDSQINYDLDISNLTPVPPVLPLTGALDDSNNEINIYAAAEVEIYGREIIDAVNILLDGNMNRAHISEFGYFMGVDFEKTDIDINGQPFQYKEAKCVQLAIHECSTGHNMSNPADVHKPNFELGIRSMILPI